MFAAAHCPVNEWNIPVCGMYAMGFGWVVPNVNEIHRQQSMELSANTLKIPRKTMECNYTICFILCTNERHNFYGTFDIHVCERL